MLRFWNISTRTNVATPFLGGLRPTSKYCAPDNGRTNTHLSECVPTLNPGKLIQSIQCPSRKRINSVDPIKYSRTAPYYSPVEPRTLELQMGRRLYVRKPPIHTGSVCGKLVPCQPPPGRAPAGLPEDPWRASPQAEKLRG